MCVYTLHTRVYVCRHGRDRVHAFSPPRAATGVPATVEEHTDGRAFASCTCKYKYKTRFLGGETEEKSKNSCKIRLRCRYYLVLRVTRATDPARCTRRTRPYAAAPGRTAWPVQPMIII